MYAFLGKPTPYKRLELEKHEDGQTRRQTDKQTDNQMDNQRDREK